MKLAILAAFILADPLAAVAQIPQGPKEFAEIPWGTAKEAAKTALLAQPGISFSKAEPENHKIIFKGGTFAGAPAAAWHLYFAGDKLARGLVEFDRGGRPSYTKLKEQLIAKYGRPKTEKTTHEHTESIWDFAPSPESPQHTEIHLEFQNEKKIILWYHNASLWRSNEPGGVGL